MIKKNVNLGEKGYPIYIATDYTGIGKAIYSARISGRLVVITDTNVDRSQAGEFMEALRASGLDAVKYVTEAGEKYKNLDTIREIYKFLLDQKLDRSSCLIALGGGVIGDMTGFTAATFLRGISFVQVPTTLLAQADSSIGGKVGVDFEGSKNVVGAFYQPRIVYMNVNSLKTLPEKEMKSGLAETVKHGIIQDSDFIEYIDYNVGKIFRADAEVMQYVAKMNCMIKGRIVEQDEKESELRVILNFGHTIGHAVETVSDFSLTHGECVAVGMVGAFKMAKHLGMVDEAAELKVIALLEKIGLCTRLSGMDVDKVYNQMLHDKKRKGNKLVFILPRRIGEVLQITIDDELLIRQVLKELIV